MKRKGFIVAAAGWAIVAFCGIPLTSSSALAAKDGTSSSRTVKWGVKNGAEGWLKLTRARDGKSWKVVYRATNNGGDGFLLRVLFFDASGNFLGKAYFPAEHHENKRTYRVTKVREVSQGAIQRAAAFSVRALDADKPRLVVERVLGVLEKLGPVTITFAMPS